MYTSASRDGIISFQLPLFTPSIIHRMKLSKQPYIYYLFNLNILLLVVLVTQSCRIRRNRRETFLGSGSTTGHSDAPFGNMVLEFGTLLFGTATVTGIVATASRGRIPGVVHKVVHTVEPTNGPGWEGRSQTGRIVRVVLGTVEETFEAKLCFRHGKSREDHRGQECY